MQNDKVQLKKGLFDELDLFLLKSISGDFNKDKISNTYELAKQFVLNKINKKNLDYRFYTKNRKLISYVFITLRRKLTLYKKMEIIKVTSNGDGKEVFWIDLDKIAFGKHKFSDGIKDCIIIRV